MDAELNPYATPATTVTAAAEPAETGTGPVVPANQWLRAANFFIDLFVLRAGMEVLLIALVIYWDRAIEVFLMAPILFWVVYLLTYYIFMEAVFGRTLGKFATGTLVVSGNGSRPSFGQIVGRSFARLIPFEVFTFSHKTPRGWHDRLPDTYVIAAPRGLSPHRP